MTIPEEGTGAAVIPLGGPRPAALHLTVQQRLCMLGVANGRTNQQIAASMFLSVNTVKTHLRLIFQQIGARNRTHAVGICLRTGAIRPEEIISTQPGKRKKRGEAA